MKQEPVLTTRFIKQARKHQNAQQDKEVLPQPGIEPGPLGCRPSVLPLHYRELGTFYVKSKILIFVH